MKTPFIAGLLALLLAPPIIAAPAHVHGGAKMAIVVDGNKLTISIEMPLDSVLGFERPAHSDSEKKAYTSMLAQLQNPAELFLPTAAADCRVESVAAGDPFPGGKAKADGHADVDADYIFRCAKPTALSGVETTLFKKFSRLRQIEVERATPSGQGKIRLSPQSPSVAW